MASPQMSGYQCKFVDSVEDYECPLCLHVTREPSLTSCCGQHFCQACIKRILTDNNPCPFCKSKGFSTFLDKKQNRKVLDLKVYCDTRGCKWEGGLGQLESHLSKNCRFVLVKCSKCGGRKIQRRFLKRHEIHICPKRPHNCQYCHLRGTYKDIQDSHLPVCPKYPVQCPNECGASPLERAKLEDHLGECPLQLVECELREMGCEEMVQRKDLTRHMEEGAQRHLTLMTRKFLKTQAETCERIANLETENTRLKQNLTKTEANLGSQLELLKQHLSSNFIKVMVNAEPIVKGGLGHRRENDSVFQTVLSHFTMRIDVYYQEFRDRLNVELKHVESPTVDNCKWPKKFTVTVRMLNQAGDHDHYQITKDLKVHKNRYNDDIHIAYTTIKSPPRGIQYISNGMITLQCIVTEK